MEKEKVELLNRIVGIAQIAVALFQLDLSNTNSIIVAILLFLGGVLMLLVDAQSAPLRTAHKILSYAALVIAIGLIAKVLFLS